MKTQIYKDRAEFNARKNKLENGVSPEFAASNPKFEAENASNEGCYDCSRCSGCSGCYDKKESASDAFPKIPVVENIHSRILEAVRDGNGLEMGSFHSCETTHCRAGWAINLAGKEGRDLELKTSS